MTQTFDKIPKHNKGRAIFSLIYWTIMASVLKWHQYLMKYESKMRDVIFPRYWHFDVLFFSLLLLLFSAVKPRSFIICEHQKGVISCQNGKRIDLLNANYGRLDSETCSSSSVTRTNCRSSNSLNEWLVQNKCNGKTSCELHATNSEFGDPCSGMARI